MLMTIERPDLTASEVRRDRHDGTTGSRGAVMLIYFLPAVLGASATVIVALLASNAMYLLAAPIAASAAIGVAAVIVSRRAADD
jgi:hypothetical protein